MLKIGITGGIGSGKTTVTNYLIEKGYLVIDADEMSREITSSGGKAIPYIRENFGNDLILPDGSMDRAKMRDLIFANPDAKRILEKGTTKVVINDIKNIISEQNNYGTKVIFFSIPQLFENKLEDDYDQIWAISANKDIKKSRIKQRDGIDENIIDLIISTQKEDEYIIKNSDIVIINNGSLDELYNLIDETLNNAGL